MLQLPPPRLIAVVELRQVRRQRRHGGAELQTMSRRSQRGFLRRTSSAILLQPTHI